MFDKLKQLVDELSRLKSRADKYRRKRGRIEIAAAEFNRLAEAAGVPTSEDASVELPIADYVRLIDEYIAAECQ